MNLFVYGTLMVPDVMQAVTGRMFQSAPATLAGYARYLVKHQVYPGLIPSNRGSVTGVVYYDLDNDSLQSLDVFESDVYQRINVKVLTGEAGETEAWAYIIDPRYEYLLSNDGWDLEQFKQEHLQHYLTGD